MPGENDQSFLFPFLVLHILIIIFLEWEAEFKICTMDISKILHVVLFGVRLGS